MNIRIYEGKKGWNLSVTEKQGDDQPLMITAFGQTKEQIMALLPVILASQSPQPVRGSELAAVKRATLAALLETLDGWIGGAIENHEALDHRNCNRGEECWRQFAPSDIRNMINDVAREVGLTEFPAPLAPREDQC